MNEENKMHRRHVIGGIGATLAAVAVSPVFASPAKKINSETPEGLEDPVTKYPKPPFPGQTQPWPA